MFQLDMEKIQNNSFHVLSRQLKTSYTMTALRHHSHEIQGFVAVVAVVVGVVVVERTMSTRNSCVVMKNIQGKHMLTIFCHGF